MRLWRKWFKKEIEIKCGILNIPLASVNVDSYVCSDGVFALWSVSRSSKKTRKLFFARWRKILWGIIEWGVVCLGTWQFLQVLQHQQNLFITEKIKSYPNQIPKMSYFGWQKRLEWTVHNLALSSFYTYSGLFAIMFVSNISALIPRDFRKRTWSNINETRGEITRTIDFPHLGLTMSNNIGADWKIKDFPNPFGWITNTSRPLINISSPSRCKSFRLSIWKVSKILLRVKAINSTSSAIFSQWSIGCFLMLRSWIAFLNFHTSLFISRT